VQRLFSTFPNGWPGAGLLLVRLCLGTALIWLGIAGFLSTAADTTRSVENVIAAAGGTLLLTGLWTPLAGGLAALAEIGQALSSSVPTREAILIHAFLAILSVSVAMLGPGAWSIDARLFGRQHFDLNRTRSRKP
jgi:uncharacterized membrane protein YphA (DoxX/SURF4 family)